MTKKKSRMVRSSSVNGFQIGIYTRVSTEEQAENPEGSIKNQEQRLREYVQLKNMVEPFGEVTAVYSDPGVSAKDMNRPGFQKMLRAIETGEINLVLVTELSRFSRSTKDFANLQAFLEEHDCKFMSIRENFDTSGAAGSMVLSLMASIAEFERRQTGERIANSFLARAKRGLYNGGSVPLGYKIDPERPGLLFIDEDESGLVKIFFETFLKEQTLAATAKAMNEKGIQLPRLMKAGGGPRGKFIRFDTVYRILRNKAYIGIRVFKTKKGWEEVPATWKPLIDDCTFARVQKMLDENCSRRKTHKNKFPFTLSGLVHCQECGERMSGASATSGTGQRFGYYEHLATRKSEASLNHKLLMHKPRRVPATKIEPLVWTEVQKFILSEDFVKTLLARAREVHRQDQQDIEAKELQKKLQQFERQTLTLAERIADLPASIDPAPLITKLGEIQASQKRTQEELKARQQKQASGECVIELENLEIFRIGLRDLIKKGEADLEIRSKIIKLIVHKIEILKDGFEIHFHVGKGYYEQALGEKSSGASFFVSNRQRFGAKGQASPNFLNFFRSESSSCLTNGGPDRDRTDDLLHAMQARSQLRYRPTLVANLISTASGRWAARLFYCEP